MWTSKLSHMHLLPTSLTVVCFMQPVAFLAVLMSRTLTGFDLGDTYTPNEPVSACIP